MIGRGEHSEIVAFVGRGVDSELSGNMIDICPVGALTSKPFRYAARTWELARRRSVSPHDSLGSNLIVQAKGDRVLRVVPFDNPAVNECWISDKDRFSYEALASDERLTSPMIKDGGEWRSVDWPAALEVVVQGLRGVTDKHGGAALGTLISPHATLEEMALAARLTRALGSDNVDFRLRQSDFRGDGQGAGIPWLGMPVADLDSLERVLVVGSFLRQGPPAGRAAVAPGSAKGRGDLAAAFGRGRLADPPRAFVRRGALAAAACAGRNRRRGGAGGGQAGAGRARRHRAGRRCRGDRREPAVGRAQGDPAREFRRAARGGVPAPGAGAGAVRHRRCAARLPDGGREQCRRACCGRVAASGFRIERGGDARGCAQRAISSSGPSRSSTARIRSRRVARSSRPSSSS